MRATVVSLSRKLLSTLFAATLAFGLVPATAFAAEDPQVEFDQNIESIERDDSASHVISTEDPQGPSGEIPSQDEYASEDSTSVIPAENVINQTMPLETVAQQESTRSYFLAQTLESTKTIPMVSANLPLDEGVAEEVVESDGEGAPEEEGGEDSDESDLAPAPIAPESTVIGSFTSRGLTYAVEPGGETVALAAADYSQLPQEWLDAQTVVVPSVAKAYNDDYFAVARIADYALAGNGDPADITTLTIPASVTTIDTQAFTDFTTLQYLVVSEENIAYSSYDGALYDADQLRLLLIPEGRLGAVRVAPSVTEVDPEAFSHCPSVETLVADANSAAHQLLSENDLYNANNEPIEVVTTEEALDVPVLYAPDYTELVTACGGDGVEISAEAFNANANANAEAAETSAITLNTASTYNAAPNDLSYKNNTQSFIDSQPTDIFNPQYLYKYSNVTIGASGQAEVMSGKTVTVTTYVSGSKLSLPKGYYARVTGVNGRHLVVQTTTNTPQTSGECYAYGYSANQFNPSYGNLQNVFTPTRDMSAFYNRFEYMTETERFFTGQFHAAWWEAGAGSTDKRWSACDEGENATDITCTDIPTAIPNDPDHVFVGWFYGPQKSADPYADSTYYCGGIGAKDSIGSPVMNPSLNFFWKQFYAHYAPKEHDLVFDANGAEHPESDIAKPVVWVKRGSAMPSTIKTTKELAPADGTFAKPYASPQTFEANANASGVMVRDVVAKQGDRPGYEFNGYWTTRYTEDTSKTENVDGRTVTPRQYYDKNMNPIGNWDEAAPAVTTLYAHWKYKVVLDLNTYNALGELCLTDGDTKYEAELPANFAVTPAYITIQQGKPQVEVYTFDAVDGAPVAFPQVTRTGYKNATSWKTAGEEPSVYSGTPAAPFRPELSDTSVTSAYDGRALVLFADWEGKVNTYKVTLTSDYGSFKAAGGHTTEITAQYDAPLLKVKDDGSVVTWVGEASVTAPWILNSDGNHAYAFAGYYDQENTLDGRPVGTCWMGYEPVVGSAGYGGAKVTATDELYRTAGTSKLFARWTRVESGLTLDPQGGTFRGETEPVNVDVEDFALVAKQPVVALSGGYDSVPVRPGYRFAGWWDASTKPSSSAYATRAQDETNQCYYEERNGAVAPTNATWPYYVNTTLYAHWEYDLTFAANAGSDTATFSFAAAGQGSPSSADMPALAPNAGGGFRDAYGNRYYFVDSANSTSAVDYITVLDGTPVNLPNHGVRLRAGEPTGYAFTGFYANAACDGSVLTSSAFPTAPRPVVPANNEQAVVHAGWNALSYTVTLRAKAYQDFAYRDLTQDMTTTPQATLTAIYDSALTEMANMLPEMRGYSFLGWFDAPQTDEVTGATDPSNYSVSGATKFYDRGGPTQARWTKTATEDLVLYAHYRQIPYQLTFELNGATMDDAAHAMTVFYGKPMSDVTAKPYLDGYEFKGWKESGTETTSALFNASGEGRGFYLVEGNTALEPIWEGKTYKITWMLDYVVDDELAFDHAAAAGLKGGKVVSDTVLYKRPVAIPDAAAYKAYDFRGWYTGMTEAVTQNQNAKALDKYFDHDEKGELVFWPQDDKDVTELVFFASWAPVPRTWTVTLLPGAHSSFDDPDNIASYERAYGDELGPVKLADVVEELKANADAGWAFAGWNETTGCAPGEPGVAYDESTVPLGTGNREFTAQWVPDATKDYKISFRPGRSEISSSSYPYDWVTMMRGGARLSADRELGFDASVTNFSLPYFEYNGVRVTDTLGFTFKGWYRADSSWNVVADEPLDLERDWLSGQELADIASDVGTTSLKYVAKWEPKKFKVLYRYDTTDGADQMDLGAYDSAEVSYLDAVTLARPSFDERPQGAQAAIFESWTDRTGAISLNAGSSYDSVAKLVVQRMNEGCVDRANNTITLYGKWNGAYAFTVPLTVNIAIDPERAEGTVKGQGFISTTSTSRLYVDSVAFTRDEDLSWTLEVDRSDRSGDVCLSIEGEGAATPLLVDLSAEAPGVYTRDYDKLAEHGLASLRASNASTPATLGVTYDLAIRDGADLTFQDFKNLLSLKDVRDHNKKLESFDIGRVMYTLSLR